MCDLFNKEQEHQKELQELATLLSASAQGDVGALKLNQALQQSLEKFRKQTLELLKKVRDRYKRNEELLINRQKAGFDDNEVVGLSGAVLRGGTFRFKGNLYFRDADGRSCPSNEDYERRCTNEMFPTDFDMRSKHVWTVMDKKNIIMGVKQQLLDHAEFKPKSSSRGRKRKRKPIDMHQHSVAELLSVADRNFSIDWNQISILDLEYRHSAYSCEAMWLVYLQPHIKRDEWTDEEDQILLAAAKENKMQNWVAIASKVERRSDYQCFVRMQTKLRNRLEPTQATKWSYQDSERLCALVLKNTVNGNVNWSEVAQHFPNRSRSTLIGRYVYSLNPNISHAPFTNEEDVMLFAAVKEYDGKFNCFPRTLFPNRSLAQLRARYKNVLAQRNKTDSWSVKDDENLMAFVAKHGTSEWVNCAKHLGNHSRTSCRTRFLVIKRFLEKHPNSTEADLPRRKTRKNELINSETWEKCLQVMQADSDPDQITNETLENSPNSKNPLIKYENDENWELRSQDSKAASLSSVYKNLCNSDHAIYEYFMYAYNLNLRSPAMATPPPQNEQNFCDVAYALRFQSPGCKRILIRSACLPSQLLRCYNKVLRRFPACGESETPPTLLPPNWSTMMGFRAMCILSVRTPIASCNLLEPDNSFDESRPELQLFRQRLRTLFYRTTLLSRLEVAPFEELPNVLMKLPGSIEKGISDYASESDDDKQLVVLKRK